MKRSHARFSGTFPAGSRRLFYTFAFASIALAAYSFYRRFQTHRRGRKVDAGSGSFSWRRLVSAILFQEKLRRDRFAGVAHLLTFYGFVILFWGTCLVFLEHDTPLHFFYGWFYQGASLIIDLGGLAFVAGLGMFAWRRYSGSQQAILKEWWVAALLWLLLAIGVTGFLLEGARIAENLPVFERWSVVGYAVANGWRAIGVSGEAAISVHRWLWGRACTAVCGVLCFAAVEVFRAHGLRR